MKPRNRPRFRVIEGSRVHERLYQAHSTADKFELNGVMYCDVPIGWFMQRRDGPPFPYREIIDGYSDLDERARLNAEMAVDELLTKGEVDALKAYLARQYDDDSFNAVEEPLPIPRERAASWLPTGAIPVGGPQDFLLIDENPSYSLPFSVWGYFDVRGCLCKEDGSGQTEGLPWPEEWDLPGDVRLKLV